MLPLKITFPGDFWDSQLYKGRLYLWGMDNSVTTYDWDSMVASLATEPELQLPLDCAFLRGDLLYRAQAFSIILNDHEIKEVLRRRFESASSEEWVIDRKQRLSFKMGKQDNIVNELPDDTLLYNDCLFEITAAGLYIAGAHKQKRNVFMIDRKGNKSWDGQGVHLQAGRGQLAIAAANDGLFELPMWDISNSGMAAEPSQVSDHHTLFANYLFASLYGSSDVAPGYLAAYKWVDKEVTELPTSRRPFPSTKRREFARYVPENEIFGQESSTADHALTFGNQEKLYRVDGKKLTAVRFVQKFAADPTEDDEAFEKLDDFAFDSGVFKGPPMSGAATCFGVITEFENGLSIQTSDGQKFDIKGDITRWRVFPRSVRYENQLHVIMDDCLIIYSFNHDYLVNQGEKSIGTKFRPSKGGAGFGVFDFEVDH